MGLSWIISSNKQMKYEIKEKDHHWLNKGPWYNTNMCSKFNGTVLEYFIRNSITDRYNIICSITAHVRQQPIHVDDASSAGGIAIHNNATTAELKSIGETLDFIGC